VATHKFFFSYARANSDPYLKQFFNDLSDSIRGQLGLDQDEVVGFFDQREFELGSEWLEELHEPLQSCPVLVSLYSPAYFRSVYCGKEWEWFRRRRELYVSLQRQAGNADVRHPAVLKPVIWIPFMEGQEAPAVVSGPQYYSGDPREDHNKIGLNKMRKQHANFETNYDRFIENLKKEIIQAQHIGLPPLQGLQNLDEIESAFHPVAPVDLNETAPPPVAPATLRQKGPKSVRFVFIAGQPDQFPAGARQREYYLQLGGPEWKPYYPEASSPIMSLAQRVAADLEIFSNELRVGENLAKDVRDAESEGSLVVLFVDSWTAELPEYRRILSTFDQQNYFNCSIFVPWNEKDPQTAGRKEELRRILRDEIFPRWSRFANLEQPIYFRDQITSISDLSHQLEDTLRKLQPLVGMGVVERATKETIPRRIETDITRPVLSHRPS
jgi:FxsC-like protein